MVLLFFDSPGPTFSQRELNETFEKFSILFEVKKGENFNHRNIPENA
jgi:hypothetical protein